MVAKPDPFFQAFKDDQARNAFTPAIVLGGAKDGYGEIAKRYNAFHAALQSYHAEARNGLPPKPPSWIDTAFRSWVKAGQAEIAALPEGKKIEGESLDFLGGKLAEDARKHFAKAATLPEDELVPAMREYLTERLAAIDTRHLQKEGVSAFAPLFVKDAARELSEELLAKFQNRPKPEKPGKHAKPVGKDTAKKDADTFANIHEVCAFINGSDILNDQERLVLIGSLQDFVDKLPSTAEKKMVRLGRDVLEAEMEKVASQRFEMEDKPLGIPVAVNKFITNLANAAKIDPRDAPTAKNMDNNAMAAGMAAVGLLALGSALKNQGTHARKIETERAERDGTKPNSGRITMQNVVVAIGATALVAGVALGVGILNGNNFSQRQGANITHLARRLGDMVGLGRGA